MDGFTDAHIHLAHMDLNDREYLDSCSVLYSCTARPIEWEAQMEISKKDRRVVAFYGTHTWYCSEHNNRLLEGILNEFQYSCIGEIGLDSMRENIKLQRTVFEMQLELAEHYERPVTIHMVKSEKGILDTLREYELKSAILHSFDSESYVRPFTELGCFFSLSPRILRKNDDRISALVNNIPLDRLLIESDYPDCNGSMTDLVAKISSILSIDWNELLNITGTNARKVLQ